MKIFLTIISLFVFTFSTTPCVTATTVPEDRWLHGSAGHARALELQRELNVPLVVYFYVDWCSYCHALDSQYLPTPPVQQYLREVVKVRINPEHGPAEREIANRYGVRGYPAFFIIGTVSSPPRKVHPFRRSGANLTPDEFASLCRQGNTNVTASAIAGATRHAIKAQIVEVTPSRKTTPAFATDASLPTVDAILTRYVAAIGGVDANKRLTSRISKGRVDVPGVSFGGKLEVYAKAPNKSLTVMDIEPMGLMKQGFDGRIGWSLSGNGLDTANKIERAALVDADFYREIRLRELYARIRLIGKMKEGFREVYLVEAVPRGGIAESLYFDVDTGLLVRRDLTRQTSKGAVRAEIYFSDWREVDGVRLPFKMTQLMPTMKFVTTLEDVKHNVPIDEAIFRRP